MSHRRKHPANKTSKSDESRDFANQIATSLTSPSAGGAYVLTTIEFDTDITPWTVVQGAVHEFYEVSHFDVIFKSDLETTARGRIGQFYIPDPNNAALPTTGSKAGEVAGSKPPGHIYSNHVARYYPPKKKLFCYDTAGDRRFEMVGLLGIWTEGTTATTAPGTWHIRMSIRFWNPVPASVHLTAEQRVTLESALFDVDYQIPLKKVKRYVCVSDIPKSLPAQIVQQVDHKFRPLSITSTQGSDSKQEETPKENESTKKEDPPILKKTTSSLTTLRGPGLILEIGDKFVPVEYGFDIPFEGWSEGIRKQHKVVFTWEPSVEDYKLRFEKSVVPILP